MREDKKIPASQPMGDNDEEKEHRKLEIGYSM